MKLIRKEVQEPAAKAARDAQNPRLAHTSLKDANERIAELEEEVAKLRSLGGGAAAMFVAREAEAKRHDAALAELQADMGHILRTSNAAIIFLDSRMRIRRHTAGTERYTYLRPRDRMRPIFHLNFKIYGLDIRALLAESTACARRVEKQFTTKDDSNVIVRVEPYLLDATTVSGYVVTFLDVTRQLATEAELFATEGRLQQSQDLLRQVIDVVPHIVYARCQRGRFTLVNEAAARFFGRDQRQMIGTALPDAFPYDTDRREEETDDKGVLDGQLALNNVETTRHAGTGGVRTLETSKMLIHDPVTKAPMILTVSTDITDRKQAEDELRRRAFFDLLTGLPNRDLFVDRLEQTIRNANRDGRLFAMLFLDLDSFKEVNDSAGHLAGDELLVRVAGRLMRCLRPGDTVARFGGDEFAVLLETVTSVQPAKTVANRIHDVMRDPFEIAGERYLASVSVGIAIGGRGDSSEVMLRNADVAMYRAKAGGPGRLQVFDAGMHQESLELVKRKVEILEGLKDQFFCHFQPLLTLESPQRLVGLEALARWNHPRDGVLNPGAFLDIARQGGTLIQLEYTVLARAFSDFAALGDVIPPTTQLHVNLSPELLGSTDAVTRILGLVSDAGVSPDRVTVELTETSLIANPAMTSSALHKLKVCGMSVALDDFGTGYSSLSHLHVFPIDSVKIDRSFVAPLKNVPIGNDVVEATMSLARTLGLSVTAEGIETQAQLKRLAALGVDVAQGYLLARPMPMPTLATWLVERRGTGACEQPVDHPSASPRCRAMKALQPK